jgi:hypothetical protein
MKQRSREGNLLKNVLEKLALLNSSKDFFTSKRLQGNFNTCLKPLKNNENTDTPAD